MLLFNEVDVCGRYDSSRGAQSNNRSLRFKSLKFLSQADMTWIFHNLPTDKRSFFFFHRSMFKKLNKSVYFRILNISEFAERQAIFFLYRPYWAISKWPPL